MQQGYMEYGGYDYEVEVCELVTFWVMVETVAKVSEKSDLVDRVLKEIGERQLYVSYESVVVLDDVVQQDFEGFLSILDKVLHMIRNAPDPLGETFYGGAQQTRVARFSAQVLSFGSVKEGSFVGGLSGLCDGCHSQPETRYVPWMHGHHQSKIVEAF